MEPTKNLPQKLNSTALKKALVEENMAVVIREVSQLTVPKILDARKAYDDLVFKLENMRSSYRFFYNTKGVPGRIQHLQTLRKEGAELAERVKECPRIYTIMELRHDDEELLQKTLMKMIINLLEYYHTTQIMTPGQITETSIRIVHRFGGLTLEDLALCFHRVKNGDYGTIYNRVDGGAVMTWVQRYEDEVRRVGMDRDRQMHNQSKSGQWKDGHEYRIVTPTRIKNLI